MKTWAIVTVLAALCVAGVSASEVTCRTFQLATPFSRTIAMEPDVVIPQGVSVWLDANVSCNR